MLTGKNLALQLRVPAVSRLQKIHNTDVALRELQAGMIGAGLILPVNVTSKDLVDGHREKTLALLWSLIFGFQLTTLLDVKMLRQEVAHLKKSLRVRARLGDPLAARGEGWLAEMRTRSPPLSSDSALEGEAIQLLKEWSQLVTAHYNIQVLI
jgi:abnormal spindle-like microcephaly-associated protein